MSFPKYALILFILLLPAVEYGHAQTEQPVEKSEIIESIDGKEFYLHFVKKGETLFAIARAYGVTVDDIFRTNPDSRNGIREGNVLKVPVMKGTVTADKGTSEQNEGAFFYHVVKKQETLYGISVKYGVSIDAIRKLNPGLGEYPKEGETLKIPVIKDKVAARHAEWEGEKATHTIQQGETLYSIAKDYNVTIGEIINANPGLTEKLTIGTSLVIPNQGGVAEEETTEEKESGGLTEHKVQQGETLYGIAHSYSISIDTLKKYNPGVSAVIAPAQVLRIPPVRNEKGYIVHKPAKNESLNGISQKYEVEIGELEKMNPGIGKKAKKGQAVRIPVDVVVPEEKENDQLLEGNLGEEESSCLEEVTNAENIYNVALMLPLFLEEIDSIDFNAEKDYEKLSGLVSFRFAGFYAGFKMAVDSMTAAGMKVNLFVYDVDNDPAKADKVLKASELSSMDLIVGPFYLTGFRKIADFARTYGIPIINPLSEREEIIYNNPEVYKLKPSYARQTDLLANYLVQKYPRHNIILLRHNKYKYQKEVSFIRNTLNAERPGSLNIPNKKIIQALANKTGRKVLYTENKLIEPAMVKDRPEDSTYFSNMVREVTYVDDSLTGLTMNLSLLRPNVVVTLSDDIVFSKEILSQLNKLSLDHEITLFGLPAWGDFADMETNHLMNLHVHMFSPSLVNYSSGRITGWIREFRQQYNTEPTPANFAFDGFDAGWYFLNAMYRYGRDFSQCLPYHKVSLLQTNYEFESTPENGFQNTYWNLGIYSDYEFRKIDLSNE